MNEMLDVQKSGKSDLRQIINSNGPLGISAPPMPSSLFLSGQPTKSDTSHQITVIYVVNAASQLNEVMGGSNPLKLRNRRVLHRKMANKEYRHAMVQANYSNRLSLQIRMLREKHGLTQRQFAKFIGTQQSAVARLEDAEYGKYTFTVLNKIAKKFDVALWAEFMPFSRFVAMSDTLETKELQPSSYDEEFDHQGDPKTLGQTWFEPIEVSQRYKNLESVNV